MKHRETTRKKHLNIDAANPEQDTDRACRSERIKKTQLNEIETPEGYICRCKPNSRKMKIDRGRSNVG